MEELKSIVRRIRAGEEIRGYRIENDILYTSNGNFKIQGTERLKLTEVVNEAKTWPKTSESFEDLPMPVLKERSTKEPKPRKNPRKREVKVYQTSAICECGVEFALSKFNQNIKKCPNCRKTVKKAKPEATSREYICTCCGDTIIVSKFQPYHHPDLCKKCLRKENRTGKATS